MMLYRRIGRAIASSLQSEFIGVGIAFALAGSSMNSMASEVETASAKPVPSIVDKSKVSAELLVDLLESVLAREYKSNKIEHCKFKEPKPAKGDSVNFPDSLAPSEWFYVTRSYQLKTAADESREAVWLDIRQTPVREFKQSKNAESISNDSYNKVIEREPGVSVSISRVPKKRRGFVCTVAASIVLDSVFDHSERVTKALENLADKTFASLEAK